MRCLNGGWTYTWQGDRTDEFAKDKSTILEAIQKKIGNANVTYAEGTTYDSLTDNKKSGSTCPFKRLHCSLLR